MNIEKRYKIEPFVRLGEVLRSQIALIKTESNNAGSIDISAPMQNLISDSIKANSWFTKEYILLSIEAICNRMLDRELLTRWLSSYQNIECPAPKRVGVVMAGNIPLVGFSDMLAVLICGHSCIAKPSSKDQVLIEHIIQTLKTIEPSMPISMVEDNNWECAHLDAVIATGSNNTGRYFKAHFADIPIILRGSRHSVALLDGKESMSDLVGLRDDIFQHFGMGCRNVSHIFVPDNYDFTKLIDALQSAQISNQKFLNNYLESRALLTMSNAEFFDGGFFILQESDLHSDYISTITYSYYSIISEVEQWCITSDNSLQAVVSKKLNHPRRVNFGQAQHPSLLEYPDGVDVMDFLHKI